MKREKLLKDVGGEVKKFSSPSDLNKRVKEIEKSVGEKETVLEEVQKYLFNTDITLIGFN